MIPRVPEDAFIALLRRVYHNGRHCSGRNRVNGRGLSCLRVVTRPSPPTLASSPPPWSAKRHASTSTKTKKPSTDPHKTWGVARHDKGSKPSPKKEEQKQEPRQQKRIAVLGGGITGLTTAHYLARFAGSSVHVTLYEASDRLGGWIDSVPVPANAPSADDGSVEDGHGDVLLQQGPRMLRTGAKSHRYDDLVLYDVIASLGLQDKIRHPIGPRNRYVFYPDHLVKLPSTGLEGALVAWDALWHPEKEPLWEGCIPMALGYFKATSKSRLHAIRAADTDPAGLREAQARQIAEAGANDESVGAFLTRAFGNRGSVPGFLDYDHDKLRNDEPVHNLVSAMLHGIYGGDAWRLSARHTIFDRLWYDNVAPRPPGQIWMPRKDLFLMYELIDGGDGVSDNAAEIVRLAEGAVDDGWNVLAFEDGLGTLVRALVRDLEEKYPNNVTIRRGEPVTSLEYKDDHVLVKTTKTAKNKPEQYDHVISTIFSKHLAGLVQHDDVSLLPALAETHAVTIMVVNLWYPGRDLLAHNHGFGYLVPDSAPDNDEGALGVLFDSDLDPASPAANSWKEPPSPFASPPGTKLTVMLGGHHWDGWVHFPDEAAGIAMAKSAVWKHLGIHADEPVQARAKLCRDCLPQHFVGHRDRMGEAHHQLAAAFQGRLSVAGPSYTTVGVVPAMRAGWEAALRVARPFHTRLWVGKLHSTVADAKGAPDSLAGRDWLVGVHEALRQGFSGNPLSDWLKWWLMRLVPSGTKGAWLTRLTYEDPATEEIGDEEEGDELWPQKQGQKQESKRLQQQEQKQNRPSSHPPKLWRHTGLEEFAVPEIKTLAAVRKSDLHFRKWTRSELRLTVDDGDEDEGGGAVIRRRSEAALQPVVVADPQDKDGKPDRERDYQLRHRVTVVPPKPV